MDMMLHTCTSFFKKRNVNNVFRFLKYVNITIVALKISYAKICTVFVPCKIDLLFVSQKSPPLPFVQVTVESGDVSYLHIFYRESR